MKVPAAGYWAVLGVAVLAAGFVASRSAGTPGETQYFYDLSEKKLFVAGRWEFAPIAGVGGESGDGVEALVVACPQCSTSQRRVVLLTTHTPEFKQRNDIQRAGSASGAPEITRQYVNDNTLLRLPDGDKWHKASSPEAAKLVTGWKRKCATHGEWEAPVLP